MTAPSRRPRRSRSGSQLAGVCAGLAEAYDADVRLIRLAFVVAAFINGLGIVGYLLLWAFMSRSPGEPQGDPSGEMPEED